MTRMMGPVLTGSGLKKSYGDHQAVAGIDIDLVDGEALAIMGPSGSGKSTLLHLMAAVVRPDAGHVTLRGERIDNGSDDRRSSLRRRQFGFVFQSGALLPELPADENVALPLMLDGVSRRDAVARAQKWFAPLGLDGLERRRPGQLSGGQAQRTAIARALVTEPDVIFADEPTGALDQTTGREVIRTLVGTAERFGKTLVVVTHDASVAQHCHRVIEVRDGRVVGQ